MTVRGLVISIPYILAAAFIALVVPVFGGMTEIWLRPVLSEYNIWNVRFTEDSKQLCWTWGWRKEREAVPIAFRYYIQLGEQGPQIPVFVTRQGAPLTVMERPPGSFVQDFCAAITADIPIGTPVIISGYAVYETHEWWQVKQDLPVVRAN